MHRLPLTMILLLCCLVLLAGCGGGNSGSRVGLSGGIRVSVIFPPRAASVTPQSLPSATNSIRIQVCAPGHLTPIVPDRVVARSGEGPQTAVFEQVPVGPCLVRALAYESLDGSGQVIAQAEVLTSIAAGQLTKVSLITEALVVRVVVLPDKLDLEYIASGTLTATCYDADDNVILDPVKWESDSDSVSVAANGEVTGAHEGSAVVRATHEASGLSDVCDVTVFRRHTAVVRVAPDSVVLWPPDQAQVQLTATAYDAKGVVIPYATIAWASDSAPMVTVNSTGLVSTISTGSTTATITASAGEGVDGTCDVKVAPAEDMSVEIR